MSEADHIKKMEQIEHELREKQEEEEIEYYENKYESIFD